MNFSNIQSHLRCVFLAFSAAAAVWVTSPACAQTTVTSSIANNATGVPLDTPMKFTFSKAMDTTQTSATFLQTSPAPGLVDVTDAWNPGNTVLTCSPTTGTWPATAGIQWILSATDIDGMPVTVPPFGTPPMGTFTTGSSTGGGDTNPPVLLSSTPTNNATGVPLNHAIIFAFDEAMQASESIQWSANLTPTKFAYNWSSDAKTLTCAYSDSLPTNATVTWKLNPSGLPAQFKDTAGNALASDISGSFTTSNTNDLCNPGPGDTSRGSFSLTRQVGYVQTGAGGPTEDTNTPTLFAANLFSPTNGNPVTSARLDVPPPVGSSLDLTNSPFLPRMFFSFDEYGSQALLDAARPPGNYTLHVNRTTAQSVTLNLKASDWPPVPQISNLPALQNADAASDVLVQWNGFTGAGASDSIQFHIDLGNGSSFDAPDPCVPIELANTAKSIIVPKGILTAGRTYDAMLTYFHFGPSDTNTIPDIPAFGSASKTVRFTIVTGNGGTQPKSPTIGSLSLTSQGLQSQITGAAPGQSIQVQQSSTLLPGSWTLVQTIQADASGNASFVFPLGTGGPEFFRLFTP